MLEDPRKHILFVDDEPKILQGLRRNLCSMQNQWKMSFAEDAWQAIGILRQGPVDVIVSDIRMPGMDGAELLAIVRKDFPQTARILLSGHSNNETILRAIGPTHQFLSKPCPPEVLKRALTRTLSLRGLLSDDTLVRIISGIELLPSPPQFYQALIAELNNEDTCLKNICELIGSDPAMTAKILQLVNSDFFGNSPAISSTAEAIDYLGLETIRGLVLSFDLFNEVEGDLASRSATARLFEHSVVVGVLARQIANCEGEKGQILAGQTFTAGLLHDIGKLVLVAHSPEDYAKVLSLSVEHQIPLHLAEQEIIGATHAEIGAYLLGLWGLPDPIVEAVALHHVPENSIIKEFSPLTAVHIANSLSHSEKSPFSIRRGAVNNNYLRSIDMVGHLPNWELLCQITIEKALADELQGFVR